MNEPKREQLRPCPFCGSTNIAIQELCGTRYAVPDCDCVKEDEDGNWWVYPNQWQNAYCWKQLDQHKATIQTLRQALVNIYNSDSIQMTLALAHEALAKAGKVMEKEK